MWNADNKFKKNQTFRTNQLLHEVSVLENKFYISELAQIFKNTDFSFYETSDLELYLWYYCQSETAHGPQLA